MKKVLLTGAALMLAGGMFAADATYAAEPGVKITGNARVRLWYKDNYAFDDTVDKRDTSMDSRVRLDITGTAAGGAYAKVRIRMMENLMGDADDDGYTDGIVSNTNIWVDKAYVGIPLGEDFTLEVGKYRSTYGPLGTTYNFFYDDVHLTGMRGIMKMGDVTINPFMEWMEEAQNTAEYAAGSADAQYDHDVMRFGVHAKAKVNADWTVGGMVGYQTDNRVDTAAGVEANEGFFGSIYAKGQSGAFGIYGEFAVTDNQLNGMNSWLNDSLASAAADEIGSDDTGFGGYIFPNFQMDKLNIGLNIGFTNDGFTPDEAFGFVMLGGIDNSKIAATQIGTDGDWIWGALVANYQISDSLLLTGNFVYADIDAWGVGEGPTGMYDKAGRDWDSAWELSAVLKYTISKGADVYFSAGYLNPEFENNVADDAAFGALTRFELKF
nr:hypothetical protein [uncultured Desulfobulbus sp.]